jgi:hypothetical protein
MKINFNKLYVVYNAAYNTRKGIFSGNSTTMQELKIKFKRGLDVNAIDSMYSTKKEANDAADKLFKKLQRR